MALTDALEVLSDRSSELDAVTFSYGLSTLPRELADSSLPAMVARLVPHRDEQETRAWTPLVFDGSKWRAVFYVEHICYWIRDGVGLEKEWKPALYAFIHDYLNKIAEDGFLEDELAERLQVLKLDQNVYRYPDPYNEEQQGYQAARFLHRWEFEVDV